MYLCCVLFILRGGRGEAGEGWGRVSRCDSRLIDGRMSFRSRFGERIRIGCMPLCLAFLPSRMCRIECGGGVTWLLWLWWMITLITTFVCLSVGVFLRVFFRTITSKRPSTHCCRSFRSTWSSSSSGWPIFISCAFWCFNSSLSSRR